MIVISFAGYLADRAAACQSYLLTTTGVKADVKLCHNEAIVSRCDTTYPVYFLARPLQVFLSLLVVEAKGLGHFAIDVFFWSATDDFFQLRPLANENSSFLRYICPAYIWELPLVVTRNVLNIAQNLQQ